jgi:hypothetical protein
MKTKPHLTARSSRAWGVAGVLLILLCWQISAMFLAFADGLAHGNCPCDSAFDDVRPFSE